LFAAILIRSKTGFTEREADHQSPPGIGSPKRVITRLQDAMPLVGQDQQRRVEENLFRLALADALLLRPLAAIARIPLEPFRSIETDHRMYMTEIYECRKQGGSARRRVARAALPRILPP
jgi:hypothetical protein